MSDLAEGKVLEIGLDKTPQDVIDSNQQGLTLRFKEGLDEFLELDDETIQKLSNENRTRYFVSLALNRKLTKQALDGVRTTGLEVGESRGIPSGDFGSESFKREAREMNRTGRGASATQRLKAIPNKEFASRFDVVWKRPDELQTLGYEDGIGFVTQGDGVAFNVSPTPSGRYEIKSVLTGETELIAVKIPKEVRANLLREPGERSEKRKGNFDKNAQEEMSRDGGKVFIPGKSADTRVGNFKKLGS